MSSSRSSSQSLNLPSSRSSASWIRKSSISRWRPSVVSTCSGILPPHRPLPGLGVTAHVLDPAAVKCPLVELRVVQGICLPRSGPVLVALEHAPPHLVVEELVAGELPLYD